MASESTPLHRRLWDGLASLKLTILLLALLMALVLLCTLAQVREGQLIRLSGHLVQVEGDDGFRWVSSRTRDDTGDGACEVIWVEQLQILD